MIRPKGRIRVALSALLLLGAANSASATTQSNLLPPGNVGQRVLSDAVPTRILVAQTQEEAQLALRIQQLEEQLRTLNGQVDGLTFQLTQMQTLIDRMRQDNEGRFQALEGGAGGKNDAATQSEGVTPDGVLPQDPSNVPMTDIPEQGVVPLPGEAEVDPTFTDGAGAPTDDIGASGDPLVGTGAPLDLNYTPGQVNTDNADADAQYQAGYEAILRGDYLFAEDQFSQYIQLYPDSPQYSDAANWLGEALLQRGAYDEAADVLLTAFQKRPDSPRAPDLLLRLGMSLSGAGERDTACRTLAEIDKRYTDLTPAFATRLQQEQAKAQCPPA
ncbi:tol-pal system protein YbgF [Devosia rhodophyticola]|uniref:Cell division coordinator CpoB n=1 Tax=Devosia rhodophyticola TaxID=3026423 RepID=A0ABY7YV01_9HYPH|nr:tol-pal system protein YbgF [Devosia rhodophyticola]WDR04933.1 tol-pal system protein YbgF [Devosia rhodophyticola]